MSFRLKTILGIALIEAVLLSLLLWAGLGYMAESAETEFRQRTEATLRAYAAAAKDALISSDLAALESLTAGMLTYPGVEFARVLDRDGRLIADARRPGAPAVEAGATEGRPGQADVMQVAGDVSEAGMRFGRIELGVSAVDLRRRLAEGRRVAMGVAALEMLLVAGFSWLLGAYLTRQLRDLSGAATRLAAGELGLQIPVRGRDELAGTAVAFNDMSARLAEREAALAARDHELRLRGQLIEASPLGAVVVDARAPDLPLVDVNPAFERITGYTRAEVLGRNCRFLQGPDTDAAALDRIRAALKAGRAVSELLLNHRRDGSPFWNELQIRPVHDATGQLTHFVALQADVSARVAAQQALAAREAYLRQVLDATHDGIIVTDSRGTVESYNAGAERMFGHAADEVIGRNVSVILPPAHQAGHDAYMQRYLASGTSHVMGQEREFEARRKDGSPMWIALRLAELPLAEGLRFIGVVHDITERKLGELELQRAKQAAEQAAHAKSEFLANMSHEIRTPMHGVLGAIEMLRDSPLSAPQRRYLDTANTSATLLLGVIDEILDFSRLEAGKLRIEQLDFDLRQTVEDVTAMLAQRAHAKRVELACFIAPEVPGLVRTDPVRLRQVLVNLVVNAIKFTDQGEVVVTVLAEGPDRLRFEVRDTGIGIAPEQQARLFQPFTQADSSTSRRFGGSGLGLSIARRLVELLGGEIGVVSALGQGSTFWFTMAAPAADPARRAARPNDFQGTKVLVVDDNATNRVILHRYLTAWGAQSSSAAGGEEALAKLQDAALAGRPYQLVLMDLNMPGMDGYELLARMQAAPPLGDLPVLMLSSTPVEPARLASLRVDVWLDKPVRQSDLHDAIATVLSQPAVAAAGTDPAALPLPVDELHFDGERVLLVEDNPTTGELGRQMLLRRGLAVSLVTDGRAAVEAVQRGGVDLVLMDIQMPLMDGYQATQAIRDWELAAGRHRLPIVALTAHALPADRARCLAAGMDDYVAKPFSGAALSAVVARWLAPPGWSGSVAAPAAQAAPAGPVAAAAPKPVLDPQRLAELRMVMGAESRALLRQVSEALGDQMAMLAEARANGDAAAVRELAHRIKNTAGDIGAGRLMACATEAEQALQADPTVLPPLDPLLPAFAEALGALERAIEHPEAQPETQSAAQRKGQQA